MAEQARKGFQPTPLEVSGDVGILGTVDVAGDVGILGTVDVDGSVNVISTTSSSTINSSTTPLAAAATFTGTGELSGLPDVMVTVATDQNGTLYFDFSTDGINWDSSLSFIYDTTRINPPHILVKGTRYFRVRFTNTSTTLQTYFRLSTQYGSFNKLTAPLNGTVSENYDALVTRPSDYRYEVAMGKRQGRGTVNKWGYNEDIDTASPEIVASFGGAFDPTTDIISTAQTFTITYNNATDGLGQTGATQLIITYLDADFLEQSAFHILSNTGSEVTAFTGLGINRVVVYANGGLGYNANDITLTATTDTTIQARVPAEASVTQQCIFHTQINHTLLLDFISINALKITGGGGNPEVTTRLYSWSRVTETRYELFNFELDTALSGASVSNFSQPFIFGGREVIWLESETDANNTKVSGRFSGIQERVS